jgi:hypothetical protein
MANHRSGRDRFQGSFSRSAGLFVMTLFLSDINDVIDDVDDEVDVNDNSDTDNATVIVTAMMTMKARTMLMMMPVLILKDLIQTRCGATFLTV